MRESTRAVTGTKFFGQVLSDGKSFFFFLFQLLTFWLVFGVHPLKLFYRFSPPDFSEPDFYPTELNG